MFPFLAHALVAAALSTPSPSPSPLPEVAHVVTSDRADEPREASARTTYVVTKTELRRHGYVTVADAIATIPGVYIARYGVGGAAAHVGIRGSTSAQVLTLINGVPAAGSQIGGVDLASLPTDGVERIEVVEGGGSTLYGSGSLGGIINIITTPLHGTAADLRAGSFGERDLRVETPHLSFERAVARDAFSIPGGTMRENADYDLWNARAAFDRQFGAVQAQFFAGITDRHQGVPGGDSFLSPTSRQNDVSRDAHAAFTAKHGAATTTLDLSASSSDVAFTCDTAIDSGCPNAYPAPAPPSFSELVRESRVQVSLRTTIDHATTQTIAGIDLSRGIARIDDGVDPIEVHPFSQSAAYAQQRWAVNGSDTLYAGLRAERDGTQGGAFSPSIGGIARLGEAIRLRANFATAFRAPTAEDLYYPFFSNPNVVPERTNVADLSLDNDALLGGASLGWFSTDGRNLIVDDSNYIPQNIGHASIQGLTASIRTRPEHGIYAKMDVTNLYRAQDLQTNQRLSSRGPVFGSLVEIGYAGSTNAPLESWAIDVRNEGDRASVDHTLPLFDQAAAYTRVDAFFRYRFARGALVTLRGENLGNERYAEIAGYPMPGRAFSLELSTR